MDWCNKNAQTKQLCHNLKAGYCLNESYFKIGAPESAVCKSFYAEENVNADDVITKYCQTLKDPVNNDLCSCFMGNAFYDKYFDNISNYYSFGATPKLKHCYFGKCASSNIKPYSFKQGKESCPEVFSCVSVVNVDNKGNI